MSEPIVIPADTRERREPRPTAEGHRGRSLGRGRGRFVVIVLLLAVLVQSPLLFALGRLTGHPLAGVGMALVLTAMFAVSVLGPRAAWGSPGRLRLYLSLWPFFVWWTVALVFLMLAPLALLASLVLPFSGDQIIAAAVALAVVGAGVGLWQRPRLQHHELFVEGWPAAFEGYRVVQISDLHCGPFASGPRVEGWVAAVNRLDADLVAVTGDYIASGAEFVPVVASALGRLRARDGVFASMGNHDYFTDGEALAEAIEQAGLTVLRNRGVSVSRGDAAIHVAGVDDTWTRRHDLEQALAARPSGVPVVLLAHDPALFPEIVRRGVELTLSGHTHGGQVGVPLLARRFNMARVLTPFTSGFYRVGGSTLYVNRGLGTTGPPVRLGVSPEIAVFTLRRQAATAAEGATSRAAADRRAGEGQPAFARPESSAAASTAITGAISGSISGQLAGSLTPGPPLPEPLPEG